ncbi:PepSY-associated TM helix domain-containing protein [Catenovulum sediminis]|uniref:PepSY-associated TM helix domain-containing protein n=1 Tax=Catenovulum sediminis TaxID=1740262 RepID=UPI00117F3B18|nr:PepSY-associated TM helix domain-containing protein [Catenovulum sediminis]
MKNRFRQSMNGLHTWTGFAFAWLLYFIFVTGTLGYFEDEIDRWMQPEMSPVNQPINYAQTLQSAQQQLEKNAADSPSWYLMYPTQRSPFVNISWLQPADPKNNVKRDWQVKNMNIATGETLDVRETSGGMTLYRMHYNLHYIPKLWGYILTSLAAMLMLIGLITGIIIHKKIFVELFTFRANKGLRSWLDIHNVLSVLPLPFHLMITYSGLMLLMVVSMSTVIEVNFGEGRENNNRFYKEAFADKSIQKKTDIEPQNLSMLRVLQDAQQKYPEQKISYIGYLKRHSDNPHFEVWFDQFEGIERASSLTYQIKDGQVVVDISDGKMGFAAGIYDFLEHLHEGLFADIYLRWLYFLSGLMGATMIASGTIIWIKKRLKNAEKKQKLQQLLFFERLNIAMIIGLPISVACYFLSNRLLPVSMPDRAEWEVHCMFLALLISLLFCTFRAQKYCWRDMLWIASASYLLLPVINYLYTGHHIAASIINEDWIMFGFDLTALITGAVFACTATLFGKKNAIASHAEPNHDETYPLQKY